MEQSGNSLLTQREQRQLGIAQRNALGEGERLEKSRLISAAIRASSRYQKAQKIFVYRSISGEVDTGPLILAAQADGKLLAYPCCFPGGKMLALRPKGEQAWQIGKFGIPAPDPAFSETVLPGELDLILAPCTAFDGQGHRVGMGGGYYDRFLKKCTRGTVLLMAFEAQRMERIQPGLQDVDMDGAVTENGLVLF